MDKIRDSSFELLRLLCIFGIIFMHTFGAVNSMLTGFNTGITLFINSLFNTGVTCFILISGYFGIKFNLKKMLKLDMMVVFYSLLGLGITYVMGRAISVKSIITSLLPVISRKYWFISCYFWLMALSPFLNLIPEKMGKKHFQSLLITLLILFSIIPTFLNFEIMQDSGKGLVDMIMIYLIGQYIRMYLNKDISQKKAFLILLVSLFLTFGLNLIVTIATGINKIPFARDCSLFIIISSVAIFIIFKNIKLKNNLINILASNVLAIYVFEDAVRTVLGKFIVISDFINEWYLFGIITIYVLITMIICIIINTLRDITIARIEPFIIDFELEFINYIRNKVKSIDLLNKWMMIE